MLITDHMVVEDLFAQYNEAARAKDMKLMWKVLNKMEGRKKKFEKPIKIRKANGELTKSDEELMEAWKDYMESQFKKE